MGKIAITRQVFGVHLLDLSVIVIISHRAFVLAALFMSTFGTCDKECMKLILCQESYSLEYLYVYMH